MPMKTAQKLIDKLNLAPLPGEGGMFREIYRAQDTIPRSVLPDRFDGDRAYATSIYYLLQAGELSIMHRLHQDEVWHFYQGNPLVLGIIDLDGTARKVHMGHDMDSGEQLQLVLYAGQIFGAQVETPDGFSLVGCTVAPGFEYADFEAPSRSWLLSNYPRHKNLIMQFSRAD